MIYDLHTHSLASDGILSTKELLSRAKQKDVDVLALTDHDTTVGVPEAKDYGRSLGIKVISGVEFSSIWEGRGVHVVGLNIDINSTAMCQALESQARIRSQRSALIDQRLAKVGVEGALEGALKFAQGAIVTRPHFADFLVEAGYVTSVSAAFKKYLGTGKPGDVKNLWPELEVVIKWIVDAGGVPVLAHPNKYKLTRSKLHRLVEEFQAAGGRAIEVISGYQQPPVTLELAKLADKFTLFASCGSDFHRPDQPWQELGQFGLLPNQCRPVWDLW